MPTVDICRCSYFLPHSHSGLFIPIILWGVFPFIPALEINRRHEHTASQRSRNMGPLSWRSQPGSETKTTHSLSVSLSCRAGLLDTNPDWLWLVWPGSPTLPLLTQSVDEHAGHGWNWVNHHCKARSFIHWSSPSLGKIDDTVIGTSWNPPFLLQNSMRAPAYNKSAAE